MQRLAPVHQITVAFEHHEEPVFEAEMAAVVHHECLAAQDELPFVVRSDVNFPSPLFVSRCNGSMTSQVAYVASNMFRGKFQPED